MPSLPENGITRFGGRSRLLPFRLHNSLWHGPLPCFHHLSEIINALEQQALRVLVRSQQLVQIGARTIQRSLQRLVLRQQLPFAAQTCVDGFLERSDTLCIGLGTTADSVESPVVMGS